MERLTIDEVIAHCQRHTDRVERSAAVLAFKEGNMPETAKKQYQEHKQVKEWLEELKEYKAAEEQGLLLKLPCAIEGVVWFVGNEFINDYKVRRYIVDESGVDCIQVAKEIDGKDYWNSFSIDDIGKTVFLTREEAEQALAEMKEV